MTPKQVASSLRRIASTIDRIQNPDRSIVASDLKKIIRRISSDAAFNQSTPAAANAVYKFLTSKGITVSTPTEDTQNLSDGGYCMDIDNGYICVVGDDNPPVNPGVMVSIDGDIVYEGSSLSELVSALS